MKSIIIKILYSVGVLAIGTVATVNVMISSKSNNSAKVNLANITTLATAESRLSEWWDSKVYRCEEDVCSISAFIWTWYGKYEKCKDGSIYAHCWSCAKCDA